MGLKNPNLGEIRNGPFIALRIVAGTLGTAAGLKTDERARVLKEDDSAIPGLYACGNDATSMMAGSPRWASASADWLEVPDPLA